MSQLIIILLTYVNPFCSLINPNTSRNGLLFGDEKGPWSTTEITAVLSKKTKKRFGFAITTQMYRHISIAIDRKFMRGVDLELEDDEDDPNDLMATHTTHTANARYARLKGLIDGLSTESIDIFREISDTWQEWYMNKIQELINRYGLVSRLPKDMELENFVNISPLSVNAKIDKAMRHLYGPSWDWRSKKQEEGLQAVIEGNTPLFIILPTGAGKTVMFEVPALFDGAKSTIVILPLVALSENLMKRCKDDRQDVIVFGQGKSRYAKIIIMIMETATSPECRQFIQNCHLDGQLERIVFDECHMIGTEKSYRLKLQILWRLNIPVQYIFMSATYPPSFAPIFEEDMLIKDPITIREMNNKVKCYYSITKYQGFEELKGILKSIIDICINGRKVE